MVRKSGDKVQHEADTVGYMPERFITGYFELVRLGLQADPLGQSFENESSAPKKKYHQHGGGLRDEAALRFKAWVDRQLRAIGRDVQAYLNARDSSGPSPIGMSQSQRREIAKELERKSELKCSGGNCGKYISWQWSYCAWCGKAIYREGERAAVSNERPGSDSRPVGGESQSAPATDRVEREGGERLDAGTEDGGDPGSNGAGADNTAPES